MNDREDLDARLKILSGLREQDLVQGLVEEIAGLHRQIAALRRELAALAEYQASSDRLLVLDDAQAGLARLPRFVVLEVSNTRPATLRSAGRGLPHSSPSICSLTAPTAPTSGSTRSAASTSSFKEECDLWSMANRCR
jgi:hypothetical protein